MSDAVADVLVPVAVDQLYSYKIPPALALAVGDIVTVALGSRETVGVVWAVREGAADNLKPVLTRCDLPALAGGLRAFIDWMARWTLGPRGMILRMALRAPFVGGPEPVRFGVRATSQPPSRPTPARLRVLAAIGEETLRKRDLATRAGCSTGVIDALVDDGALDIVPLPAASAAAAPDPSFAAPVLGVDQAAAAAVLRQAVREGAFCVTLLEGVTGSGKTETYFEAVAAAIEASRQVLILMPEIALTAQFLDRFAARFGTRPAEWHSAVPGRLRARIWEGVAAGDVPVVVGARSSLFLPFRSLGLVVVDEEHEAAYKQEDGVTYHARDMAVVRGQIEGAPVVLASATPSIETRVNAAGGRYAHLRLPTRYAGRALPQLAAIDLRRTPPPRGRWLAPPLVAAMRETQARGEQTLLFLNRRGYAPLTLCRTCGHRFGCPHCSTWLVEHRFRRALVCHHCGHVERRPDACPNCDGVDTLTPCGPGIERLAEEVAEVMPDARALVLSSDFPGGTERLRHELAAVADGAVDIVIGTQLVAKGHNFPLLTLVGVVDADVGLSTGDPRAAERTFQLLQQVTGRAGRFERPGRALIQTWQPDHPVLRAIVSGDAERFYREETEGRRLAALPPFGRLAGLVVSGHDRASAEAHARALLNAAYRLPPAEGWTVAAAGGLPGAHEIHVLGPSEAPIAVLRGRHRFRLLVRAPRGTDLQGFLRAWRSAGPPERGGTRLDIDVEPQSFL